MSATTQSNSFASEASRSSSAEVYAATSKPAVRSWNERAWRTLWSSSMTATLVGLVAAPVLLSRTTSRIFAIDKFFLPEHFAARSDEIIQIVDGIEQLDFGHILNCDRQSARKNHSEELKVE